MDRECLYLGHPDTCTPWHYLELDGGRRIVTRVLVKVWRHRHPETTSGDLAVVSFDAVGEAQRLVQEPQFSVVVHEAPQSGLESRSSSGASIAIEPGSRPTPRGA
jgi:hypothetical protein